MLLDLSAGRAAQKRRFGGELFPNVVEAGSGLVFAEFFQNERDTDLKVFFTVVAREPVEVTSRDVMGFITEQRRGRAGVENVVRISDGSAGLSAATIKRRLAAVSALYGYLVVRGDAGVTVNPVPRGLPTRQRRRNGPPCATNTPSRPATPRSPRSWTCSDATELDLRQVARYFCDMRIRARSVEDRKRRNPRRSGGLGESGFGESNSRVQREARRRPISGSPSESVQCR